MRTVVGYDADGHKVWSDSTPSRGRIPWTQAGSIAGVFALPTRTPVVDGRSCPTRDYRDSSAKGWQTRKLRGSGLEP